MAGGVWLSECVTQEKIFGTKCRTFVNDNFDMIVETICNVGRS